MPLEHASRGYCCITAFLRLVSVFQSFDFPTVLLVPLSFSVGSESAVSAFKLTGSPNWLGLSSNLSIALCLKVLCPSTAFPPLCLSVSPSVGEGAMVLVSLIREAEEEAPRSWFVGEVLEVSAFREIGSPSWEGLVLLVSRAISRRVFLLWKIESTSNSGRDWEKLILTEGAIFVAMYSLKTTGNKTSL